MTEQDLARAVVTELQRQGYETYEEVSTGYSGSRADIVAVRGPILMVVETKLSLSLKLLDQLTEWLGEANYIVGAVEAGRFGIAAQRYLQEHGIGLWTLAFDEIHEKIPPRLFRNCRRGYRSLRAGLRSEHKSGEYAKAGSQGGGYWTPFRGTCKALRDVVTQKPGISLRDALAEAGHHYSSTKSAISALPGLIRKGVVEGVSIDEDSRPLRLYPSSPLIADPLPPSGARR